MNLRYTIYPQRQGFFGEAVWVAEIWNRHTGDLKLTLGGFPDRPACERAVKEWIAKYAADGEPGNGSRPDSPGQSHPPQEQVGRGEGRGAAAGLDDADEERWRIAPEDDA